MSDFGITYDKIYVKISKKSFRISLKIFEYNYYISSFFKNLSRIIKLKINKLKK